MRLKKFLILSISAKYSNSSQPGQLSYFYLNFGPFSASVSSKAISYKKSDCKNQILNRTFIIEYTLSRNGCNQY